MKAIIFGFPTSQNTYYFNNLSLEKTLKYLGYETYWLSNGHGLDKSFFDNSIIYTEGWETDDLPVAKNSFYVINHFGNKPTGRFSHNIKYLCNNNVVIDHRYLCESFEDHNYKWDVKFSKLESIDKYTYIQKEDGYTIVYQPEATDLLPYEINYEDIYMQRENVVYFIGSVSEGYHNDFIPNHKLNNKKHLDRFELACKENNVKFIISSPYNSPLSIEEHKILSQKSLLSVDSRDDHKKESKFIPGRIFKNISYGHIPITNSPAIFEFFDNNIIYNEDLYYGFYDGLRLKSDYEKIRYNMEIVKNKHTYINRIKSMLSLL